MRVEAGPEKDGGKGGVGGGENDRKTGDRKDQKKEDPWVGGEKRRQKWLTVIAPLGGAI